MRRMSHISHGILTQGRFSTDSHSSAPRRRLTPLTWRLLDLQLEPTQLPPLHPRRSMKHTHFCSCDHVPPRKCHTVLLILSLIFIGVSGCDRFLPTREPITQISTELHRKEKRPGFSGLDSFFLSFRSIRNHRLHTNKRGRYWDFPPESPCRVHRQYSQRLRPAYTEAKLRPRQPSALRFRRSYQSQRVCSRAPCRTRSRNNLGRRYKLAGHSFHQGCAV